MTNPLPSMLWQDQEAAAATEEGKGNEGEEEDERQEVVVSLARTLKPSVSNFKALCNLFGFVR